MHLRLVSCLLTLSLIFSNQINIAKGDFVASVIEYQSIDNSSLTPEEQLNANTANYLQLLESAISTNPKLDLIVYPEATLYNGPDLNEEKILNYSTYVKRDKSPCELDEYPKFMKDLSCAAKTHKTVMVVNLIEKEECDDNDDDTVSNENCKRYGHALYNTNVIFGNDGKIIDRYRKYNLFAEDYLNKPKSAEKIIFQIKNHTFGTFTCFDILFEQPALNLVSSKVENFVFPTMWFSELPFLTALQVQMMWSIENGVNLFASGANNPLKGSGGTGIYKSNLGALVSDIIIDGSQGVYSAQISDISQIPTDDTEIDDLAKKMDKFNLLADDLSNYSSILINTSLTSSQTYQVCSDQFCCDFDITVEEDSMNDSSKDYYTYHLVAFSGPRSFSGYAKANLEICAIIACLNSTIDSCAQRFPNYNTIEWPLTFMKLKVEANFTNSSHSKQYPNTLISSIRPLTPYEFSWALVEPDDGDFKELKRVISLNEPQNRLLTFGIFGIKYNDPSSGNMFLLNNWVLLVAIFTGFFVL